MRKILITGATGKIGMSFVSELSSSLSDWRLIIDTRNPQSQTVQFLKALCRHPVEAVTLDPSDLSKLPYLDGLTDVFIVAPFSPRIDLWHERFLQLLEYNQIAPRIIKVSVTGAKNPKSNSGVGNVPGQHWLGEQKLRETGWDNVSIRPNIFMQHFMMNTGLYVKGENKFYLPYSDQGVSWIDCTDIAKCAYGLFADLGKFQKYNSTAFELTGPKAISPKEMAQVLTHLKGEKVIHYDSMQAFEQRCAELAIKDNIKHFYKEAGEGWFSHIETKAFRDITAKLPKSFAEFALQNRYWFHQS